MSVLLLIAAGLSSAASAMRCPSTWIRCQPVLTASIDLEIRGSPSTGPRIHPALLERLEAAPGVVCANALDIIPVTLSNRTDYMIREGDPAPGPDRPPLPNVYLNAIGPGHFSTLQIGMSAGRDFT